MAPLKITGRGKTGDEDAAAIDFAHRGDRERAPYLRQLAAKDGLFVAYEGGVALGFACLDHACFFGRPFISLLVVHPEHRRHGVGTALLEPAERAAAGARLFTSTNISNAPMIRLLGKSGYTFCGHVVGLDPGDPELIYSKDVARQAPR